MIEPLWEREELDDGYVRVGDWIAGALFVALLAFTAWLAVG